MVKMSDVSMACCSSLSHFGELHHGNDLRNLTFAFFYTKAPPGLRNSLKNSGVTKELPKIRLKTSACVTSSPLWKALVSICRHIEQVK